MGHRGIQALTVLSPFLALGLWEVTVRVLGVPRFVLPAPSSVVVRLINELLEGNMLVHIFVTLTEIVGGFALGAVVGVSLGVAVSQFHLIEALLHPVIVSVQSVPKIALAPIIILWVGYGYESKVIVASLSAFFPVFVNVAAGLWQSDADQMRLMRSLTATTWQTFRTVKVPNALPSLFTGLEIAIVLSVVGAVVAEYLGSRQGLGYFIMRSDSRIDTTGIFVALILLAALGVALNRIVHALSRRVVFWTTVDADAMS